MASYSDFRPSLRFQQTLALSPDGAAVAYVDDTSGQFNLVVQPLDGGPPRRLTSYADNTVRRVAWHPDGGSLVYLADTKGDEKSQVYRIAAAGGEPEALTADPGSAFNFTAGTWNGTGSAAVNGAFTWNGGSLGGSGTVTLTGATTFAGNGTRVLAGSKTLALASDATWSGGSIYIDGGTTFRVKILVGR